MENFYVYDVSHILITLANFSDLRDKAKSKMFMRFQLAHIVKSKPTVQKKSVYLVREVLLFKFSCFYLV